MSKHTPGPWTVFYKHKYDEWHVSVPTGGDTSMKLALFPFGIRTQNPGADARLIAAAPDGLAAAETAYRAILGIESQIWRARNQRAYCALRDFIALATGREARVVQEEFEEAAALAKAEART